MTVAESVVVETYIRPDDQVTAISRAAHGDAITGTVIEIVGDVPGCREFVILPSGQELTQACAHGVPEDKYLFSVERGDCWVQVPPLLSPKEAQSKAERSEVNQRRKAKSDFPLFADQVEIKAYDPDQMIRAFRESGQRDLERDHKAAEESTALRDQVYRLVSSDEYNQLVEKRKSYPGHGVYGKYFWQKHLDHIRDTGKPDIFQPPPKLNESLSLPWLKLDAECTWKTAPGGPQKVRILFIGSKAIMVKLTGQPMINYDPILIPKATLWLAPSDFTEAL